MSVDKIKKIRENITPRGDGNSNKSYIIKETFIDKREYNSERRRKLYIILLCILNIWFSIRENITPRGDGNFIF